jgi:hypothetical protein
MERNANVVRWEGETMRMRLLAVTVATSLAVGMSAGSALAHFNEAAGKSVGGPAHATPSGLGHVGMECGARNDTPLQALGLDCPAP